MPSAVNSIAHDYWAAHLGVPGERLFSEPLSIGTHAGEVADYAGVFALCREGAKVISLPPERAEMLRPLMAKLPADFSLTDLENVLRPLASKVIGPAFIGYAPRVPLALHPVRALGPGNAAALEALEQSCDATEWAHGGSAIEHPCSAVFIDDRIAALAGYEVWGGTIAHISVVTHPAFRGRGFGRSAVAHLAGRAAAAGLLPQYRTLDANLPSIRLAQQLGFVRYATSLAVRLETAAQP